MLSGKEIVRKDHLSYDLIYMKCLEQEDLKRKKVDLWLPGAGEAWRKMETDCKRCRVSFEGQENVLKLVVLMVVALCEYTKNYRFSHFKWVN